MALRDRLERIRGMNVPTNEQPTIRQIIMPVLGDLGWDISNARNSGEVKHEYGVGRGRVDIALMSQNGKCACFVEAKSPGTPLDKHVDQLLRYAFDSGVPISILTDGMEWRFYLLWQEGNIEDRQFLVLHLCEDPIEQVETDLKTFLSRSAVQTGKAKNDALKVLNRRKRERDIAKLLPKFWKEMLTEPDRELVPWVTKRMFDKHGLSPSAEQVAKVIVSTATSSEPTYRSNPAFEAPAREGRRSTGYTLFGVDRQWRSGIGMWVDVVRQVHLRHEHDFLERAERLKLTPGSRRVLISDNSYDINRSKELICQNGQRIYIEYSLTRDECIDLAYQLLEMFGHPPSDLHFNDDRVQQPNYITNPAGPRVGIREVGNRPTGYTLFGVYSTWRSGIGMWIDVVEQVYYRHERNFLEEAKKHLRVTPGSNRILISERPLNEYRDWKETRIPHIFVYSNLKVNRFVELARKLLEIFGHPPPDLEIHEE